MNFVSRMEGEEMEVELKYCERCGGLWLRRQGAEEVYCASCRVRLAAMPKPEEAPSPEAHRRRKARLPVAKEGVQGQTRIEHLEGVAMTEVWA